MQINKDFLYSTVFYNNVGHHSFYTCARYVPTSKLVADYKRNIADNQAGIIVSELHRLADIYLTDPSDGVVNKARVNTRCDS